MPSKVQVRERPLIFSGGMVRAILAGAKTQTRRIMKPQPPEDWSPLGVGYYTPTVVGRDGEERPGKEVFGAYSEDWGVACPFGGPGDALWVRENFRETEDIDGREVMEYQAGGTRLIVEVNGEREIAHGQHRCTSVLPKWRPSIHMPRWASRLTLEITQVRVQRVAEISEEDAIAEGVPKPLKDSPRAWFSNLWDQINGPESWERSDWVWAISFRRLEAAP